MASSEIAVSTTPPLPGTVLVQQINDAFQAVATQFSGSVDPAAYAKPYSLWADTGTGNVKRRNAANSAWDIVGRIVPTLFEDASGNVGIGTAAPEYKVDVNGAAGVGIQIFETSTGTNKRLRLLQNSTGVLYDATFGSGGNAHVFAVGGTEAARLDSSGSMFVGTTSAGGAGGLTISPNVSDGAAAIIWNRTDRTGSSFPIDFRNGGTTVGYITYTNSSTAYVTSSDYRLKENVQPMQNALATVASLKPCTYTWKADGSAGQGFIAHELQAVVPDCVTGEKDAIETVDELDDEGNKIGTKEVPRYQGVDTSFLVATLVAAIQELKADFDAYKAAHP